MEQMTDKERILMAIITRIIPGLIYRYNHEERKEYVESCILNQDNLKVGDLVFATTTITPNDFMVGFVHSINPEYVVIREIGSNNLCNYYNECFTKINKEKLGYQYLEGIEYTIYQKCLAAFEEYGGYSIRFKEIFFDNAICTVKARKVFSNEEIFEISFKYDDNITVLDIGKLIKSKGDKL